MGQCRYTRCLKIVCVVVGYVDEVGCVCFCGGRLNGARFVFSSLLASLLRDIFYAPNAFFLILFVL